MGYTIQTLDAYGDWQDVECKPALQEAIKASLNYTRVVEHSVVECGACHYDNIMVAGDEEHLLDMLEGGIACEHCGRQLGHTDPKILKQGGKVL